MTEVQTLAWGVLALVVAVVAIQALIVATYVRLIRQATPGAADSPTAGAKAAIVLAVRGADPQLRDVLVSLLSQDHPDYTVSVVLDSPEDPAGEVVRDVLGQSPGHAAHVAVLRDRLETCSLKCSALAQAVDSLPADVDVVAFIDADARPHRSWLRDLADPLSDRSVGVVNGNRWFLPPADSHGSLVRHYWNAGAVVQVWFNGIPWAGSMALRRRTIDATGIVASWRRSLSVDGAVGRKLKQAGLAVRFAPSVMMINEEHVSRQAFASWLVRQLVAARSSGSGWPVVIMHACLILVCLAVPPVLFACGLLARDVVTGGLAAAAAVTYWTGCLVFAAAIDGAVRSVAARQGQALPPGRPSFASGWRSLCAVVDAHVIHLGALARATVCRTVSWRGIEYEIRDVEEVRMISYGLFQAPAVSPQSSVT